MRWLIQKFIGFCGLIFILWLVGGSVWVGQWFFQQPLSRVNIKGNLLLKDADVLFASGLRQGQRLIDLNPYQVAARLQTHPIVQKTDIRRKFPDEIHLIKVNISLLLCFTFHNRRTFFHLRPYLKISTSSLETISACSNY